MPPSTLLWFAAGDWLGGRATGGRWVLHVDALDPADLSPGVVYPLARPQAGSKLCCVLHVAPGPFLTGSDRNIPAADRTHTSQAAAYGTDNAQATLARFTVV